MESLRGWEAGELLKDMLRGKGGFPSKYPLCYIFLRSVLSGWREATCWHVWFRFSTAISANLRSGFRLPDGQTSSVKVYDVLAASLFVGVCGLRCCNVLLWVSAVRRVTLG